MHNIIVMGLTVDPETKKAEAKLYDLVAKKYIKVTGKSEHIPFMTYIKKILKEDGAVLFKEEFLTKLIELKK